MSDDDAAYRRSARNMAIILAAVVIVIFAAIFGPQLLNPVHEQLQSSGSVASPYGFALDLRLNDTALRLGSSLSIAAWLNSTSPQPNNVTAASSWSFGPKGLWTRPCTSGWPFGIGVMKGYYSSENYSLGSLVPIPGPLIACPVSSQVPSFFVFRPFGTVALVEVGGTASRWDLRSTLVFSPAFSPPPSGVYTAVAADEWGDVVLAHFRVSQ
jgi:hypothetical protein